MSAPWLALPRGVQKAIATSRSTSASIVRSLSASSASSSSSSSSSPRVICRACRRSRGFIGSSSRNYSSTSSSASLQLPASGVAALASRRLISVSGPDAAKYLQGVITASILRLQAKPTADAGEPATLPPAGLYAAFLSAQGRVLHDVFVYRDTLGVGKDGKDAGTDAGATSFLIEVDAEAAATLAKHIKRYKLRAKFDVRLLEAGELTVWHGWGLADRPTTADNGIIAHHDTRAPGLGWRFIAPSASWQQQQQQQQQLGLDVVDESAYRVHRYLLGVGEGQREILYNQALPLESNMDVMGGIDYNKGCYVGQELTIRTRHRGVVRKRILPCIVYGGGAAVAPKSLLDAALAATEASEASEGGLASTIPAETSIGRVGKRGRSAGKWLSGVGNLGLALCRLETMTDIVLPGEAAAATTTFDPASEFVMNVAETGAAAVDGEAGESGEAQAEAKTTPVKIRAFVPGWLRQGLAPAEAKREEETREI